jgi:DNA polymerase I-like protein with 3'-5' exonuclease and polymerase domains
MMEKSYVLVDSIDKVRAMIEHIKEKEIIAFDIETDSLNPRKGKVIGFSVSAEVGKGFYMPTLVLKEGQLADNYIGEYIAHDLAKKYLQMLVGKKLIMHNGAFDCPFVKNFYGIDHFWQVN